MSAMDELVRATVTVQSPTMGSVSVVLEATAPVGEPVGRSEAVVMLRQEARTAVGLLERAAAMARDHITSHAPGALDEEQGSPTDVIAEDPSEEGGALGDDAIQLVSAATGGPAPALSDLSRHRLVEVYTSREEAGACKATKRLLDRLGVGYVETDIDTNPSAWVFPLSYACTSLPAVLVYDSTTSRAEHVWGGHRPDLIHAHLAPMGDQQGPKGAA